MAESHTLANRWGRSSKKELGVPVSLSAAKNPPWFSTRRHRHRPCPAHRFVLGLTKRRILSGTTTRDGGTTTSVPDSSSSPSPRPIGPQCLTPGAPYSDIFEAIRGIRGFILQPRETRRLGPRHFVYYCFACLF